MIEALERGLARLLMKFVAGSEHAWNFNIQNTDSSVE
jgi:hypothetical protein